MKCLNCGRELAPGAKFCAGCGTMADNAFEQTAATYQAADPTAPTEMPGTPFGGQAPEVNMPKKKMGIGKKIAIAVGGVAAAAAIAVGGFFLVQKLLPKTPEKSLDQSLEEYTEAADTIFGADLSEEVAALEQYSMDLEIELTGGSELPKELQGAGISYAQDVDVENREIGASLGVNYSSLNLAEIQLLIEDSELYVGMEDLLGEGLYGIDTETIGKDIASLGVEDETGLLETVGFNLFDLAEAVSEVFEGGSADAWVDVWVAFAEAVDSEKDGEETIDVNGHDVKCTKYRVTIKEDSLKELADGAVALLESMDYEKLVEVICEELGLPGEVAAMILEELELDMPELELDTTELVEAIEMIGNIGFDVYINGGKIMAVVYEEEFDGVEVKAGAYFGGGKNYVDDWSVIIETEYDGDKETVELTSTGNHAGKGGEYTDETGLVYVDYEGEEYVIFTSEIDYAYEEDSDNFSWVLSIPEEELVVTAEGTVNNGDGQILVDLDTISVEAYEETIISLAVKFRLGEYERRVDGEKQLILDMSKKDLMLWVTEVGRNAQSFMNKLEKIGIEF